jgi:hypothetical protein
MCLKIEQTISRQFRDDRRFVELLNGKHLGSYLETRLSGHPVACKGNLHGFAGAIPRVMLDTLEYSDPWASLYRAEVRALVGLSLP